MDNSTKEQQQDHVRGQDKSAVWLAREMGKIRIVKEECRKHASLCEEANSPFTSSSVFGLEQPLVQGFYCGLRVSVPNKTQLT